MQKSFIIWLVFALIVAAFAVVNAAPVAVNLLFARVEISLALLVLGPLFIGAALGYTLDLPRRLRARKERKALERKLEAAVAPAAGEGSKPATPKDEAAAN